MRIAVTGAEGMLGHDLMQAFSDLDPVGFTLSTLDVTDLGMVMKTLKKARPEFLVHAAAFTNVDLCETEREHAYRVNGLGTRNVAMACEEIGCPMVYLSTDYVFDGSKKTPYDEWDRPSPVNVYGLSKLMGEAFVSTLTNRFYIVRTSWLYGGHGKNFVDTIIGLLTERDSIDVVHDQTGCPTYARDLARKIRELIGRGYGVYHITNSGHCTWYDFARAIAEIKGLQKKIIPVMSDKFDRPARRPHNSVLGNTMLRLEGIREPRNWKEALGEYLGT